MGWPRVVAGTAAKMRSSVIAGAEAAILSVTEVGITYAKVEGSYCKYRFSVKSSLWHEVGGVEAGVAAGQR